VQTLQLPSLHVIMPIISSSLDLFHLLLYSTAISSLVMALMVVIIYGLNGGHNLILALSSYYKKVSRLQIQRLQVYISLMFIISQSLNLFH
jgi:hypothetical protein